MIVLDASALLAFLFREAGHDRVAEAVSASCISTVNLSEVIGRFARDGHDPEQVLARIEASPIQLVPFLAPDAALAGSLVPATLPLGLSLGDRACLALAMVRRVPALTADRAWSSLDLPVRVQLIR